MLVSVLTSILMLVGKLVAYGVSHSYAILADAAESVVHGVATGLAAFSLWLAAQPPDRNHPYGHGRIAYFSAGFEGGLVFCAACAILLAAVVGLTRGTAHTNLGMGMAITGALATVNLALGTALVIIGRRHNSLIVESNGTHVLSDMWTSLAAIIGIGLVMLTGVGWLDPLVAIGMGLYVGWTGARLIRRAAAGLMDEITPDVTRMIVEELEKAVSGGRIAAFHQLRCRPVDDELWIDVHLLVPCALPITEAHARATAVEDTLRSRFVGRVVHVISHIEPDEHELAHPDGHSDHPDPLSQGSGHA
jgi:cation diffusion facilitator family transporter